MKYHQFMELPTEIKSQVIRKCRPMPYVRLRRACQFLDEFCEKNKKALGVYCHPEDAHLKMTYSATWPTRFYAMAGASKFRLTRENIFAARNSLSGFAFAEVEIRSDTSNEFDEALNYFLESSAGLKIKILRLYKTTAGQVKRVMGSPWTFWKLYIGSHQNMRAIVNVMKKRDCISLSWLQKEDDVTKEEVVEFARGKEDVSLSPWCLPATSTVNALKAIIQNWKEDGHFPRYFNLNWREDNNYNDKDISDFYAELLGMKALHFGTFEECRHTHSSTYGIWIRKDETTCEWQFVSVGRIKFPTVYIQFSFETAKTCSDLCQLLIDLLKKVYEKNIIDFSALYESCQAGNLEEIKKTFSNNTRMLSDPCAYKYNIYRD